MLHALIPESLGERVHLRCEALLNSTTGPGRPVATYLRDWRTLGGIRPSGLAFFSECHPVHTRRSPGTGWLDKPVKADIATSHDKRGGSCCLAAAFDFYFGLMFDDTLVLHGVCGLQTMCPQYISLAKMGCHFGSRIRTLILQDQRLLKPTLHFPF